MGDRGAVGLVLVAVAFLALLFLESTPRTRLGCAQPELEALVLPGPGPVDSGPKLLQLHTGGAPPHVQMELPSWTLWPEQPGHGWPGSGVPAHVVPPCPPVPPALPPCPPVPPALPPLPPALPVLPPCPRVVPVPPVPAVEPHAAAAGAATKAARRTSVERCTLRMVSTFRADAAGRERPRRAPRLIHVETRSRRRGVAQRGALGRQLELPARAPEGARDPRVLNALWHHGSVDGIVWYEPQDFSCGCSTPYGITARWISWHASSRGAASRAQRLTASRLGACVGRAVRSEACGSECSTPYGITARCISSSRAAAATACDTSAQRLTASRLGASSRGVARDGAATRRGAQRLTASRLGASDEQRRRRATPRSAQRLTASRLGASPRERRPLTGATRAQRLTASRLGAYLSAQGQRLTLNVCSTPYGITARCIADGARQ